MSRVNLHQGREYKEWKEAVLKKDKRTCFVCRSKKFPTADHIKPVYTHPELVYDIDNGRVICDACRPMHDFEQFREGILPTCTFSTKSLLSLVCLSMY